MSGVRSFVAIELAPDIRRALAAAGAALREAAPAWRQEKWVAETNLHITLKFLGSLDEAELPRARAVLGEAVAAQPAFALRLSGLRAVPSTHRATMVWATFEDAEDGACAALAAAVDVAAAELGVARDERHFRPHVTLVRSRRPRRLHADALTCANEAIEGDGRSMSVPCATLFASTLTRQGPIYQQLERWALTEGAEGAT